MVNTYVNNSYHDHITANKKQIYTNHLIIKSYEDYIYCDRSLELLIWIMWSEKQQFWK